MVQRVFTALFYPVPYTYRPEGLNGLSRKG